MLREFTVRDMLAAIEKNGLPQITGFYFRFGGIPSNTTSLRPLTGACAMGQAAVNLGVTEFDRWLLPMPPDETNELGYSVANLINYIMELNDDGFSYEEIAIKARREADLGNILDEKISAYKYTYTLGEVNPS